MLSATFPTEVAIGALGRGGGEGLSCPRSRRAEAAAAPEMALAEAAESRMAAAGPSSPRQIVRAEPAGGAPRGGGIRRNYIRLLPQSDPPSSLSPSRTHTQAPQRQRCQLRDRSARSHCDKRGRTAHAPLVASAARAARRLGGERGGGGRLGLIAT